MRLRPTALAGMLAIATALSPGRAEASNWAGALRFEQVDARVGALELEPAPSVEPDEAEARAAYMAGSREYALGNYEVAVSHFERSFELSQAPELLFNVGRAYARWYEISGDLAHLRKAERLFKNYLGYLDTEQGRDPGARADAEAGIAEVEAMIAAHEEAPQEGRRDRGDDRPLHRKAWFWVAVIGGAAVVGGAIAAGVLLSRPDTSSPDLGTIGGAAGPGGLGFRF